MTIFLLSFDLRFILYINLREHSEVFITIFVTRCIKCLDSLSTTSWSSDRSGLGYPRHRLAICVSPHDPVGVANVNVLASMLPMRIYRVVAVVAEGPNDHRSPTTTVTWPDAIPSARRFSIDRIPILPILFPATPPALRMPWSVKEMYSGSFLRIRGTALVPCRVQCHSHTLQLARMMQERKEWYQTVTC